MAFWCGMCAVQIWGNSLLWPIAISQSYYPLGGKKCRFMTLLEFFVLVIFSCQVIFSAKLFQIMLRTGEAELKPWSETLLCMRDVSVATRAGGMFYCITLKKSLESNVLPLLSSDSPQPNLPWHEEAAPLADNFSSCRIRCFEVKQPLSRKNMCKDMS